MDILTLPAFNLSGRIAPRVPMGRIGEADDVAGLALFLASPAGSFINGQIIGVDGRASAAHGKR